MSDTSSGPDFDLSLLYEIADGSSEFMLDSIDMFMQQTPESITQIGDAMDAKDWPTAGAAAHKLKSTLGFFGMLVSQALIQQIESACKGGTPNPTEVLAQFNQVKANIAENVVKLNKIKAETGV